nr:response regulator transcription factor [Macrococcus hajekii]
MDYAQYASPDVILIDWMLPGLSGIEIVSALRETQIDTPIILLTAKGEIEDKLTAFSLGADDYMVKPFDIDELNMRILALNRRAEKRLVSRLTFSELTLQPEKGTVTLDDHPLALTKKEYLLLELLMHHSDGVVSKDLILDKVWDIDDDVSQNAVEALIGRLRKKITPITIRSIRNMGYQLSD